MRHPWRGLALGALITTALVPGCRSAGIQAGRQTAGSCLPASEESEELLLHIRDLTSDRGAYARHERSAAALPAVPKVDVLLIQEPALCAEGAVAYDRVRSRETPGAPVLVIRVGDRYVVHDPGPVAGAASVLITFDRSFSQPLAQWRY